MSTKKNVNLNNSTLWRHSRNYEIWWRRRKWVRKKSLNRMLMCGFQYQFQKIFLDPADFDDVLFYWFQIIIRKPYCQIEIEFFLLSDICNVDCREHYLESNIPSSTKALLTLVAVEKSKSKQQKFRWNHFKFRGWPENKQNLEKKVQNDRKNFFPHGRSHRLWTVSCF